jgi:Cu/Ag efflux pump CusA
MAPLAFGFGEGNELQAPLARAVVGGLSLSTLVTLLIVPAILQLSGRAAHGDGGSPGDSQNATPIGAAGP